MSYPYSTGDTPASSEENELYGAIQGRTVDEAGRPRFKLGETTLVFPIGSNIASATTITPPARTSIIQITGTTNITTIAQTNTEEGYVLKLYFADTLNLLTSGNIVNPDGIVFRVFANTFVELTQIGSSWLVTNSNRELMRPYFEVSQSSGQSISTGSFTLIQWDSEQHDNYDAFDDTTNYDYTIPISGYWHLNVRIRFNNLTSNSKMSVNIKNNAATLLTKNNINGSSSTEITDVTINCVRLLAKNDVLTTEVFQDTGVSKSTTSGSTVGGFTGFLIKPI